MIVTVAMLYVEAKACGEHPLHYLYECLNGRLAWLPFTNRLRNPEQPQTTAAPNSSTAASVKVDNDADENKQPGPCELPFGDMAARLCIKVPLEFEFSKVTAGRFREKIGSILPAASYGEEPFVFKFGDTLKLLNHFDINSLHRDVLMRARLDFSTMTIGGLHAIRTNTDALLKVRYK